MGCIQIALMLPCKPCHDCWIYEREIEATANTQFGQEMVLVMQTTQAQRWQYPDRVDKRLFSSIENVHRYYNNPWVWV